ncbi:homeobox Mix.2-like [Octopus vulgaris]|uniref:Homeobox Mix.2-like n=1 Tax=Octopus vulgaris TaxID=6645 RepID=A0AA36B004_OCTVU|nr:homeobox Mix.2-like [Octopus vulgaris]
MGTTMEKDQADFLVLSPRERLSYTRHQLQLLNGIFERLRYPNSIQKQIIARRVGINREQVKVWFQNRRRKEVVGKQKMSAERRVDKICKESPTPSQSGSTHLSSSSQPKSIETRLIPTVVLTSIMYELERFNNDECGGHKTHFKQSKGGNNSMITDDNKKSGDFEIADDKTRKELFKMRDTREDQYIKTNLPKFSCNSRNQNKRKVLQSNKSSKNNIFISDYDIRSPPNQITPTAIFTLRDDDRSKQRNMGTSGWIFPQLESGLTSSIDIHSNQRINNSLTNSQSFAKLPSPGLYGRDYLTSFHPGTPLDSNDISVVSFSTSDYCPDQRTMFPVVDSSTLNERYENRLIKFHQVNFTDIRSPATSQQSYGSPHIIQNINAFPFSYNIDF